MNMKRFLPVLSLLAIVALVLVASRHTLAPANKGPVDLSAFRLEGFGPLQHFKRTALPTNPYRPAIDSAPQALAGMDGRFLHGPTEVRYEVLLFSSREFLKHYSPMSSLILHRSGSPGSVNPRTVSERGPMLSKDKENMKKGFKQSMEQHHVKVDPQALKIIARSRILSLVSVVEVNRARITVWGFQHEEMLWRGTRAQEMLSDEQMKAVVRAVAQELVNRAKLLPANQD